MPPSFLPVSFFLLSISLSAKQVKALAFPLTLKHTSVITFDDNTTVSRGFSLMELAYLSLCSLGK